MRIRNSEESLDFAIKDDLVNAGGNYVDEEVVRDGNLITSRKPDDLPAFCREIVDALAK
jgi:protease I